MADLDDLFCAVIARLRATVGELPAVISKPQDQDAAGRIQASVLECVSALDQLRATLAHEFAQRQQLAQEPFDVRTALALVRARLAGGTQAGFAFFDQGCDG